MPIAWAQMVNVGGNLPEEEQKRVREYLDALGEKVEAALADEGLVRFASPLFRPFNLAVAKNPDDSFHILLSPLAGGLATYRWLTVTGGTMSVERFVAEIRQQLGWDVSFVLSLPSLDKRRLSTIAKQHVESIASAATMSRLGDLEAVSHLRPLLEMFVEDYPEPEKTVFVMMPFEGSDHLDQALEGIQEAVAQFGLVAVRADDRAYSDQLWLNVETYLVGCRYGIAVFEDLDERQFNPNVSLELGYMMGLRKRCLLLKEKRLPKLPSDIVGHLYRPWDAFDARDTVAREVSTWLSKDLKVSPS